MYHFEGNITIIWQTRNVIVECPQELYIYLACSHAVSMSEKKRKYYSPYNKIVHEAITTCTATASLCMICINTCLILQ